MSDVGEARDVLHRDCFQMMLESVYVNPRSKTLSFNAAPQMGMLQSSPLPTWPSSFQLLHDPFL